MTAIRIPGFTGEASLYISETQYNMAARGRSRANANLLPQLIRRPEDECIPGCICVSPINCPCCQSLLQPWPTRSIDLSDPFAF